MCVQFFAALRKALPENDSFGFYSGKSGIRAAKGGLSRGGANANSYNDSVSHPDVVYSCCNQRFTGGKGCNNVVGVLPEVKVTAGVGVLP